MKIGTTNRIQKLAPSLLGTFTEIEVPDYIRATHTYHEKIEVYKNRNEQVTKYFSGQMHDWSILEMKKINRKDLFLRLNDYSTLEFAYALIRKKGLSINESELMFPIEFNSSGTIHLSLNTVGNEGTISPCRFRQMQDYLYEEILVWEENQIEIAFNFWKRNSFLLLLSCSHIEIKEYQGQAWREFFGKKYDVYYHYFETERNKGRFLTDYSLCQLLIDEIESLQLEL